VRKQRTDGQVADHQRTHTSVDDFCHFWGVLSSKRKKTKRCRASFLSLLAGLDVSCYREHLLQMQYAMKKAWWVVVLPSKSSQIVLG
jgi:hypothetical protein